MTHGADTSFLVAIEIEEHAHHATALRALSELLARRERVGITPQVLTEFVHVVTDARRFQKPLPMESALEKSRHWWNAEETDQVLPTAQVMGRFHDWMQQHQLGRKRLLDTLLAASFREAGITSVLTLNATDFTVFGEFSFVPLDVSDGT